MADINWTVIDPPERKRTYVFATSGSELVYLEFEDVTRIEVRESGTHRIETKSGRKAFVRPGWIALEISVDEWTF